MKIVKVPIKDLKAWKENPRTMTEKQAKDLTDSIKTFGFVDPLIVNGSKKRKNIVIGGHMRLEIAKREGYKTVPVIYIDLEEEQEKELNLRLNKNNGEWDWDKLANLDEGLLEYVGFGKDEMLRMVEFEVSTKEKCTCPDCGKKHTRKKI